jgi:hypothetical protein
VTGSESERQFESSFARASAGIRTAFGELSLRELATVLSGVNVFVSSSTGPMHIAAAVGTQTVSMFCPLTACSPKLWGPVGRKSKVILPPDGFCQTKCPGDPHVCTFESDGEGITVETAFQATIESMQESKVQYSKETLDDNSTSHRN